MQDTQTGRQYWSVPSDNGGKVDITQHPNGQVTSVQYNPSGITGGYTPEATPANIQQYLQQQVLSFPSSGLTAEQQAWQSSYQALNDAIANDPNATVSVDPDGSININANNSTYGLTEGAAYQYAVNSSGQPVGISILSGPGAGQTFTYSSDANLVITDTQAAQITQQMLTNLNNTGNPIDTTGSLIPAGFDGVLHATVVATGSITPIAEITFEVNTSGGVPSGVTTTYYYPGTGDIVQTVDTKVNGQNVNVSFTYNADGTITAHVNSINGLPPLNQAAADAVFGQTTPSKLAVSDFTGTDVEVAVSSNDAAHPSGLQTLVRSLTGYSTTDVSNAITTYVPPIIDALSIIKAIQSGKPLPIVASGLQLANDLTSVPMPVDPNNPSGLTYLQPTNTTIAGLSSVANGALSILSLDAAIKRGDNLGAITAGLQTLNYSATAYAHLATASGISAGVSTAEGFTKALSATKIIPVLGIVSALERGDTTGVVMGVLAMNPATAPIAMAFAVFQMIDSLFASAPPEQWGAANAQWQDLVVGVSATGNLLEGQRDIAAGVIYESYLDAATGETIYTDKIIGTTPAVEGEGGKKWIKDTYQAFVNGLNAQIAEYAKQNPNFELGLVANRLPSITFRDYSGYQLTDYDPVTGQQINADIHYDRSMRLYDAPGSTLPNNFADYFMQVAIARGAIAPKWEADTAALQTKAGDPMAGISEVERAGRANKLAAPLAADATTQIFRPVALDLNGNNQIDTFDAKSPITGERTFTFNVDDSGFQKGSEWLATSTDPVSGTKNTLDGFLVLDRNFNGQIDSGQELFSNAAVDVSLRGLQGMKWVDANYDGKITNLDPVWDQIKVWQDLNGDGVSVNDLNNNGVVDAGESELKTLNELGISELGYSMSTFTQNGQIHQMASPNLTADTFGTKLSMTTSGILMQTSDGQSTIIVTQVDDLSAMAANDVWTVAA